MTRQYHLPLPQQTSMGLDDFLSSAANEEAVRWLCQTDPILWPSHVLVLWGPGGSGKTHLLSIWCTLWGAKTVSAGPCALDSLIEGGQAPAAYALDSVDALAGNQDQEEWLQHFYNASQQAGKRVLMTARQPPSAWGLRLRDITTRLKSCQTVGIGEPDDVLLRGLLVKLFHDRQLMVDAAVVDYIAARMERTGAAVRETVALLDDASLEGHRKISIPFAQKILGWKEL